jgi:hypothetical protein
LPDFLPANRNDRPSRAGGVVIDAQDLAFLPLHEHQRLTDERPFRNAQGLDPRNNFLAESLRHRLYFPREPTTTLRRRHDPQDETIVSIELATLSTFKHLLDS